MTALPWFATETVHLLTYPIINDHGSKVVDYTQDPDRKAVAGCSWQPADGQEITDRREATMRTGRLYLPAFAAITGDSLVEIYGLTYQVVGEPADWSHSRIHPHVVAVLERWEG